MLNELHNVKHIYNTLYALYGLGTETEKALFWLKDRMEIIGLLDSFREKGKLYGKRILSFGQALEERVELIIVVARPGSCRVIAGKIGDACRKNGIVLLDIRGKDLLESRQAAYDFSETAGNTCEELYRRIAQAEVVSFDLFDTLIMREVLSSSDIFEFLKNTEGVPATSAELAEMEWRIDFRTLIPRQAVCDVFSYCIEQGKTVYIVTDTYYRQAQIREILRKCHLTGYTGLLVSCEHNTGKRQKLFRRLKYKEGDRKYLHIGDDLVADIETASKNGMCTYHIFSSEELLEAAGYMGMERHMKELQERLKIGLFTARIFNDPFQFETKERQICLQDAYDIGYLLCAPVITDFVFWFREQVKKYGSQNIWFCARDGYLLKQMYQIGRAHV